MLTKDDLIKSIRLYRLDQITDEDDTIVDDSILTAQQIIKDHLYQHYETEAIFSQVGDDRKRQVLNWLKNVTMYLIYERIPDELVPERIIKNYNETMDYLLKISEGKVAVDLPRRTTTDEEGNIIPKTKTRWGSQPSRSHNF